MQVLASQLPFLANRNAELAVPPLFWPDTCIKIGGHVALLSGPTVYTLYCANNNVLGKLAIRDLNNRVIQEFLLVDLAKTQYPPDNEEPYFRKNVDHHR